MPCFRSKDTAGDSRLATLWKRLEVSGLNEDYRITPHSGLELRNFCLKPNRGHSLDVIKFGSLPQKGFAVVGMRDRYQASNALPDVLTPKVDRPVFGDHIMDVRPCGHYTRSDFENGYNFALAAGCGRGECDDRLSAFAERSSSDKVHLSTHP